jgi:hypothetical protein
MAETAAIFIGIAVLAFLALPFRTPSWLIPTHSTNGPSRQLRELREKKTALLLALRELDFDFETGKLSSEDYKDLRAKYQAGTVETMKKLEELERLWKESQERIDLQLAGGHEGALVLEKPPASVVSIFCGACGAKTKAGDRFCGHCGGALQDRKYA